MGQGTEACADRPTEVSVIRFVSRNRTIEEIAPKKEVYTCKQRGCGKMFTNQDEYKTHEALEALKIRFICREPGCGEELSDPGSMWRHYQERHNNETNDFVCPYTSCCSIHNTAENLEDHMESCHRQSSNLPMEPEIICFEGLENSIDDDAIHNDDDLYFDVEKIVNQTQQSQNVGSSNSRVDNYNSQSRKNEFTKKTNDEITRSHINETTIYRIDEYSENCKKIVENEITRDDYANENDESSSLLENEKLNKNDDQTMMEKNFVANYVDRGSSNCNDVKNCDRTNVDTIEDDGNNVLYINGDVTITKNLKIELTTNQRGQEHRIDLGNLEKVFRSGFENEQTNDREANNVDENSEINGNCHDDEEYTPKKQRMSRYKQEPYRCDVNGCGKMYKYISHYRHHQDSHKLVSGTGLSVKFAKTINRPKQGKASTVSFFLCKMPGCGAQVTNVTSLWKHYHDNHANAKPPLVQTVKGSEIFRCKIPNCEMEFTTSLMLYKHFNDVHTTNLTTIVNGSSNEKTGNGSSIRFADEMFQNDSTAQQPNFKTDFKAKYNVNIEDYGDDVDEQESLPRIKEESRD